MARITWLGEAECKWNDVVFPPGEPVETDDAYMIGKARNNPFFKVETDVSFFDDPPAIMPEAWTNTPEDLPLKRKRGRPPKVRHNGE
jgi:hypothetical protein